MPTKTPTDVLKQMEDILEALKKIDPQIKLGS